MKNINIELGEETYWRLVSLKSMYKAEKWSELIEMLLDVVKTVEEKNA